MGTWIHRIKDQLAQVRNGLTELLWSRKKQKHYNPDEIRLELKNHLLNHAVKACHEQEGPMRKFPKYVEPDASLHEHSQSLSLGHLIIMFNGEPLAQLQGLDVDPFAKTAWLSHFGLNAPIDQRFGPSNEGKGYGENLIKGLCNALKHGYAIKTLVILDQGQERGDFKKLFLKLNGQERSAPPMRGTHQTAWHLPC
ncbi:hypothetical protein M1B34_19775 [Pseudomonas sp. MAFF 302030]|uniref:Uncharacterized protein n=1 Tax=Pseudomonas morbosilactucae TaxID=2938197 RepID=A0A9X2C7N3_9PSED|nr:hypothetical protein [Pseudomonas morbosilactucae]MCK9799880.1 hypothetical protein [Pseudomonas morbosilactucae]